MRGKAFRAFYAEFFKQCVELFPVFRKVYTFRARAEYLYSLFIQKFGKFYRRLPPERHHHADGVFHVYYPHHVFGRQRFEVQPVRRVVIGGNGFGIVVDYDDFVAEFFKRPERVHRRIVEFYPLSYPYRSRTQHQNDGTPRPFMRTRFAHVVRRRIKIRRFRRKFRGAGVDGLIHRLFGRQIAPSRYAGKGAVGKPEFFAQTIIFVRKSFFYLLFKVGKIFYLIQKPLVYLRNFVYLVYSDALFYRFKYGEYPAVVPIFQPFANVPAVHGCGGKRVERYFRSPYRFHERRFERPCYRHNFARRLHLRAEFSRRALEFIERPLGEFKGDIVERGFETRTRLARYFVFQFAQSVAERDLRRYLRDRIPARLTCKRGRTRNPWVHFYHRVLETFRIECELTVTAAHDPYRRNDTERGGTQFLIFFVRKRERGRDYHRVPRMNAHGIYVFHRTHAYNVAHGIPHGLELYLFPARYRAFDEYLRNGRYFQPVFGYGGKFFFRVRYAAARTAQRICGAYYNGITYLFRGVYRFFYRRRYFGRYYGLTYFAHLIAERFPVFGGFYGGHLRP